MFKNLFKKQSNEEEWHAGSGILFLGIFIMILMVLASKFMPKTISNIFFLQNSAFLVAGFLMGLINKRLPRQDIACLLMVNIWTYQEILKLDSGRFAWVYILVLMVESVIVGLLGGKLGARISGHE